ncbi:MAG: hypothetical protein HFJ28_06085 [Clostridia bacterium]|jgi:hypothetical protein|nr:hypothetical protein [Clostridia bacterium]
MSAIVSLDNCKKELNGEKLGTVFVSMYKDLSTGLPFFYVQAENEDVLQLSYVIQDTLYYF